MRHLKGLLILAALVLFTPAAALANNVSEIDIDVSIEADGSAYVVQNWQGEFDEGTENYIPISTKDIGISEFKVSDEEGEYLFCDDWDIDADFDSKRRKCGINETSDGVELCFGISDYGEKSYKIEYVVTDFIKGYDDYDGTNFMFINPNMSTFPTNGKITISLADGTPLDENNAGIWAFRYDGEVIFRNGKVEAYTNAPLDGDAAMIVMLRLDKGIVMPETELDYSFDEVKDRAFEGSDYYDEEGGIFETIIGLVVMIAMVAAVVLVVGFFVKRKREIKKFYKNADYYRETPNGGNIEMSYFLSQNFDVAANDSLIIGALLLKMINTGNITPETEQNVGIFGKIKQKVNLHLVKEPESEAEKRLYRVLVAAAGEDGILQEKELENYAYQNPKSVRGIIEASKDSGEATLCDAGGFSDGSGNCIRDLTQKGKQELAQVIGLKKYLEDFSLIAERGINETVIWQDYMIYAALFGIADKVMKEFEKVYPDKLPELESYNRNVVIAYSYYHSMHQSAQRAIQEQRASGMGGHASFGGGGGFSGGGSGGGSR